MTHVARLGTDVHGNITRIDNVLEGLGDSMLRCEGKLASVKEQLEVVKGEVGKPFPKEAEYQEKSARLKELNVLLKLDEWDHEILDAEPDECDIEPEARSSWRER